MRAPSNLWPSTSISVSSKNTSASPACSHRPGFACRLAPSPNCAVRGGTSLPTPFVLARRPSAQRGRTRAFNQAEQVHEHAVLPQALGISEGYPATGKSEEQLGHVGHGRKSRTGAFARVQRGRLVDAFPQTKAAAERIHQHLAAMRGRLVRVGQEEVQSGFLLCKQRHGYTSP